MTKNPHPFSFKTLTVTGRIPAEPEFQELLPPLKRRIQRTIDTGKLLAATDNIAEVEARIVAHFAPHRPPQREGDHLAWAAFWGESVIRNIESYVNDPAPTADLEERMKNIVRYTRAAWFRVARQKHYKYWDDRWRNDPKAVK